MLLLVGEISNISKGKNIQKFLNGWVRQQYDQKFFETHVSLGIFFAFKSLSKYRLQESQGGDDNRLTSSTFRLKVLPRSKQEAREIYSLII